MERPRSAIRRPASAARRPPPPQPPPLQEPVSQNEEALWLFCSAYKLSTSDIALAGFTQCVLLDAARWRAGDDDLPPEMCAASEVAYTMGFDENAPDRIQWEQKNGLTKALMKSFCNRGGDLLIIFQNTIPEDVIGEGAPGTATVDGLNIVARLLCCINEAYNAAEVAGYKDLAGVSCVLEGYARSGHSRIRGQWDTGEGIDYPVHHFADAVPSF